MDRRRPELFEDFFGVKELPPASVPQVFLENVTDPRSIALVFKTYLKDASSPEDEAAVIDFATHILSMLNFLEDGKRIMTRREPRFIMCSTEVVGRPDIAIQAGYADYSLLVQTAKRSVFSESVPHLIAAAVGAFVHNHGAPPTHQRVLAQDANQAFLALTMVEPRPNFYKIPVTKLLLDAPAEGQPLEDIIIVERLIPPVPDLMKYLEEGMFPVENRRGVFQCMEALEERLLIFIGAYYPLHRRTTVNGYGTSPSENRRP